jgi:suppressor of fused-like protein
MTDTVDAALARVYPRPGQRLGARDPLDGIHVHRRADHWHFVSSGLSRHGFELTFRPALRGYEPEPPFWVSDFLRQLARYVVTSGNPFGPGHHVDLNGPISPSDPDTAIRAITFVDDPELGPGFLQIVGLTAEEYATIETWNTLRLLKALAPSMPLYVTDLARRDLTRDFTVAAAIEAGIARDGSSTGGLFVANASWRRGLLGRYTLTFGANPAPRIARLLGARLPFGNALEVESTEAVICLRPGRQVAVAERDDGLLEITLTDAARVELAAALRPVAGETRLRRAPGVTVRIERSVIRDADGAIVRVVG